LILSHLSGLVFYDRDSAGYLLPLYPIICYIIRTPGSVTGVASEPWRKNLYVMFFAEFIVLMGFSFVIPFTPLFIQELGNFNSSEAALWSGIAIGISGISLFFSGPFWGIISDRWGRKPMVLRAMFGSAVVLVLAGLSPNVYFFVVLRFIQGLLSGTVPAASALVTASAPRNKTAFAMGLLMVAVFTGTTVGPSFGGFVADILGFQTTFFISGALLFSGGLLVLLLVREKFERPAQTASFGSIRHLAGTRDMLPLLATICVTYMGVQVVQPIISLYMKKLNPAGAVATSAGFAFALMGLIAAVSSIVVGRLSGRVSLRKLLIISCLGTALLYLPPVWAQNTTQLIILVGLTGLLQGGSVTATSSLIGLSLPVSQQGIAYGLAQSATSLGNGLGPILGGSLVSLIGLRYVFIVSAGLFLLAGMLTAKFIARRPLKEV
jgi:DHA1 family multidrug resistance protein-like MFS transporter